LLLDLLFIVPSVVLILIFLLYTARIQINTNIYWILSLITGLFTVIINITLLINYNQNEVKESILGVWLTLGDYSISLSYYLDAWSITVGLISSILTLVIIYFSKYYLQEGNRVIKYYAMILTFLIGMQMLVYANNLIFTFFGWELVGICSWLLIGFFHYKEGKDGEKANLSGRKALIVTGVADVGFLVAIILIVFSQISNGMTSILEINGIFSSNISNIVAIALIIAAMGKSAQFPLHFWIASPDSIDIDAMQGPTTVSALIHAATMVNAGIYLIARTTAFGVNAEVYFWIFLIGLITAIFAGICALNTNDIKRILAYSTISQLGFMFIALGIASYGSFIALWHLTNHAFFKALLFLAAGILIHLAHTRKINELEGILRSNKILLGATLLAFATLAGIPPSAAFFSKDMIIHKVYEEYGITYFILTLIAVGLTAAYVFKVVRVLTFKSESNATNSLEFIPKSTMIILSVLVILSIFSFQFLKFFAWDNSPSHMLDFSLALVLSLIAIVLGSALGYHTIVVKKFIPIWLDHLVREAFYIDHFFSKVGKLLMNLSYQISKQTQSGSHYWNLAQFSISAIVILVVYLFFSVGGFL
jgi:NADH-quinone oxidoreductase subunit L